MKYIFLIIAVLIQPFFSYYVYHKQDKNQAALKVPMLFYSGVYLVVQFYVFFKFLTKFPEDMQVYSYLIQAAILVVFIILEVALFSSNRYVNRIESETKEKIAGFKKIRQLFEIEYGQISRDKHTKLLSEIADQIRYADPVSHGETDEEEEKLVRLITGLSTLSADALEERCREINRVLKIRKIKQEGADK